MGRSVETVKNSKVIYLDGQDFDEFDFDCLIDNITYEVKAKYKSFDIVKDKFMDYPYRETRILLENSLSYITISEYCGLAAVCIVPKEDDYFNKIDISQHWVNQNIEGISRIIGQFGQQLKSVGFFSNGEHVLRKI